MPRKFRAKTLSVKVGAMGGLVCRATRGFTTYPNTTTFYCLLGGPVDPETYVQALDELKAELQDTIRQVDAQKKELSGGPAKKRPRRRRVKK